MSRGLGTSPAIGMGHGGRRPLAGSAPALALWASGVFNVPGMGRISPHRLRGHGFVAKNGVFTTTDAPGAGAFTVVFGVDESGKTVGGYVDRGGRLHGFLWDQISPTPVRCRSRP
jgi:hypothetical protein